MSLTIKNTFPLLILLLLFFQSCKKEDNPTPNNPIGFQVPSTEDIIMYEINIGSFSPGKNLQGITARLDHIQAMGINTIWLMPIHPIGQLNSFGSPYCIRDFRSVNPQIGELQDLKDLIAEAHKRDIAVILDWVANHTSWDHSWITEHPDWYTKDAAGNIISPAGTNWTDVADLNFDNQVMRLEMISTMEYWIKEVGVDGFRCDAADLVPFDFWKQAITSLKSTVGRDIILLAEGSRENHFGAGFQINFAWDWYNTLKTVFTANGNPEMLYATNTSEYLLFAPGKRKLRFTTNHDLSNEQTPLTIFGSYDAAIAASVATIFMRGTPLIYSGQEVGVGSPSIYLTGQTIDWNANPGMLASYTSLLQFYKSSDVAKKGTVSYHNDPNFIVFEKNLGADKILVIVNHQSIDKTWLVPSQLKGNWEDALNKHAFTLPENLQLGPYEYLILKNP